MPYSLYFPSYLLADFPDIFLQVILLSSDVFYFSCPRCFSLSPPLYSLYPSTPSVAQSSELRYDNDEKNNSDDRIFFSLEHMEKQGKISFSIPAPPPPRNSTNFLPYICLVPPSHGLPATSFFFITFGLPICVFRK